MSRVAEYRRDLIARRAAASGMSVEAFLEQSEREADRVRELNMLRYSRPHQWQAIARAALAHGRRFVVAGEAV